jgi:hypothetical protein
LFADDDEEEEHDADEEDDEGEDGDADEESWGVECTVCRSGFCALGIGFFFPICSPQSLQWCVPGIASHLPGSQSIIIASGSTIAGEGSGISSSSQ